MQEQQYPPWYLELELLLGRYGGLGAVARVLVAPFRDEVDGRRQAVDRQLVAVPQLIITLCQCAWEEEDKENRLELQLYMTD